MFMYLRQVKDILKRAQKAHNLEINWFSNITIKNCTSKKSIKKWKDKGKIECAFLKII